MICHEVMGDKLLAANLSVYSQGHDGQYGTNYISIRGSYIREGKSKLRWSLDAWEIPCVFVTSRYTMVRNAINTSDRYQECHYLTCLSTQRWYLNTSKMVCVDKKVLQVNVRIDVTMTKQPVSTLLHPPSCSGLCYVLNYKITIWTCCSICGTLNWILLHL